MSKFHLMAVALVFFAISIAEPALAQSPPDPAARISSQKEAMTRLAFMDGTWRGSAWMILPTGTKTTFTQTERIGSFLDGSVRVIEGRAYEEDGTVRFNALGIVSYDPDTKAYSMRSYAMGHAGDFVLTPSPDGFSWEIPAGPATIRYTAVIKDGKWNEVGDRIIPGKDPVRFFEMNLERLGDSDWPGAGAVLPK